MASDPRVRIVLDLFESHYERVYRFARRSVDAATAEDIAQDVFTRLLRLEDLAERDIRPPYLLKIAENLIRRRFSREKRFVENAERIAASFARRDHHDEARVDPPGDPAREAVGRLGDHERQAVELTVCRGLSYRQAALSMGVKVSDVNNWRFRGMERMRQQIEGTNR